MRSIDSLIPNGFQEVLPDRYGNRVFEQILGDGRRRRIVHPGLLGDTPVFIGTARRWRLEYRLSIAIH